MLLKYPVLVLCLITLGLYFFSFFNQFVWDDEQFIYRNAYVKNFDIEKIFTTNTIDGAGEISNYYRPLTTLSFAIDYQFWGLNPFGYHVVNTLLHISSGLLIFILLKKLKFSKQLSFVAALIFLVHPLQTEAVTYVNSRGDSLFSFFLLISLLLHTLLYETKLIILSLYETRVVVPKVVIALLIVTTFIASILSKEIALAGLGLHFLVSIRFFLLNFNDKKYLLKTISLFLKTNWLSVLSICSLVAAAGGYLLLRASILNFQNTFNYIDDDTIYSNSLTIRLLTFLKIIFIYLKLFFVPFPLHMERSTSVLTTPLNWWTVAFFLLSSGLVFLSYQQWKKEKKSDILFGCLWAAIMLVPVSGIIAINGLLYEHWLYLPLVGFTIGVYSILEFYNASIFKNKITKYMFISLIVVLSFLTIRQNYFWSSPIRLYTHLLQYTNSARIHNNLAMALSEEGQYTEALEHYKKGLEYGLNYPQIYHNMGNTYKALGDKSNAESSFLKAIELSPDFFHSYGNLIQLYVEQKRFEEARKITIQAQQQFPGIIEYHLMELELLISARDKKAFDEKQQQLLQTYSTDLRAQSLIQSLRFPQE